MTDTVLGPDALGLRDGAHVLVGRRRDVDRVDGLGADRHLLHVHAAPGKNIEPRSDSAMTASAFGWPVAVSRVPSIGSTATSTPGPRRCRPPRR
jgi:hypothetical protein